MRNRGIYEKVTGSGEWWIRYADTTGRIRREKAGTKSAALALYHKRKAQVLEGKKLPEKTRHAIMFDKIAQDALTYSRQHKRSFRADELRMARLLKWFKDRPAEAITPGEIEQRLSEPGWADGTVNRYRALISLTYKLAVRRGKTSVNPARLVPARTERNVRQGFVDDAQYLKLVQACPYLWLRALLALGYTYGWRKGELLSLCVRQLDLADRTVRLECGTTKNEDGRTIHLTSECYELLKACVAGKGLDDPVFTREDESPVRDFSKTWAELCVNAGLGAYFCRRCNVPIRPCPTCSEAKHPTTYRYQGLIFHDLRRSAVRNLERASVPRSVAMKITGHRGESVYRRYAIVSPSDLADATRRLEQNRHTEVAPEVAPVTGAKVQPSAKLM
ncbi:MAG: site-specific integrase [Acidobacteria bacterium]|nr:site-specific integrase [Acidobacteriota bacterium]